MWAATSQVSSCLKRQVSADEVAIVIQVLESMIAGPNTTLLQTATTRRRLRGLDTLGWDDSSRRALEKEDEVAPGNLAELFKFFIGDDLRYVHTQIEELVLPNSSFPAQVGYALGYALGAR
jgi:hypothetical protein